MSATTIHGAFTVRREEQHPARRKGDTGAPRGVQVVVRWPHPIYVSSQQPPELWLSEEQARDLLAGLQAALDPAP